MNELFRRLFLRPWLAGEILVATFFINLLFLASPIYVIQILSRYIPYGFDGTLVTLTTGMVAAMVLLFFFSIIRNRLSTAVSTGPDQELVARSLHVLVAGRLNTLQSVPQNVVGEIMSLPQAVMAAFDATRINAVVDMPFCLLFLLAIFLLSPLLALITLLSLLCSMSASWMAMNQAKSKAVALQNEMVTQRAMIASAVLGVETVRSFRAADYLTKIWNRQMTRINELRNEMTDHHTVSQAVMQGVGGLLRVAVYAVGAKLVVTGDLTVGSLIGASILAAKALQISSSFMQACHVLAKAGQDLKRLHEFLAMPQEARTGTELKQYCGRLTLKDVSVAYPGAISPLFESLTLDLGQGTVLGITGFNGAGKSTLCKVCVGLMEPGRGAVLVDGIDLRQVSPDWWRQQVCYVPQEPVFLLATIRENITMAAPDLDPARLNEVVQAAGLRRFLDASKSGLETMLRDGGQSLPLGIRRRLALARALAVNGKLVVMDEPTEGLDSEGSACVYAIMNAMAKQKRTIIVVTQDANILKGASLLLDLSQKPTPRIVIKRKLARKNSRGTRE